MTTDTALTGDEERALVAAAEAAVRGVLERGVVELPAPGEHPPSLRAAAATFVTLERDGDLLGCIGSLEPTRPLVVDVAHNAIAAAFADPRLPALTVDDFEAMYVKISILTCPEPITAASYAEVAAGIEPGRDGVLVEAGRHRATLLPSVWSKVQDAEVFVDLLWRKAGLVPGSFPRDASVSVYRAREIHAPGPRRPVTVARAT